MPDDINGSKSLPKTIITDFKIINHSVKVGQKYNGRIVLKKSILTTDQITISYKSREFSIEFSALDYDQPEKIQYYPLPLDVRSNWDVEISWNMDESMEGTR